MARVVSLRGIAIGGAALAAACQIVAGIERVDKVEPSVASTDAGPEAAPVNPDPCNHAFRPDRPAQEDPGEAVAPFWLAVQTTKLTGTDPSGAIIGFDLDGVCTCDMRPFTAEGGAPSCASKDPHCDDDGGIDNGSAHLFQSFATPGVDFDDAAGINRGITEGTRVILMYVSDYNGQPNDLSVEVGLLLSYGIFEKDGCNNDPSDDAPNKFKPKFCGKDKWSYNPQQTFKAPDGKILPLLKGKGWVTNNRLVFAGQVSFQLFFGDTVTRLAAPSQVGTLSKVDKNGVSLWHLDGVLTGRIPATDLLTAIGTFHVPAQTKRFCDVPALFGTVREGICGSLDIASDQAFDFKGGACDAVSTAITFGAEEAQVGAIAADESQVDGGCRDASADLYTCP